MKYSLSIRATLLKSKPEEENDVVDEYAYNYSFNSLEVYDDFIRDMQNFFSGLRKEKENA